MTRTVVLFLDGVGLGAHDAAVNPLAAARLPALADLLGGVPWVASARRVDAARATLVPTDACLGVRGRPQSATGQTAILTGLNAPELLGEHYGPRPNARLRQMLEGETLFSRALAAGRRAAFVNAYPARYFEAVARGKRLHGAIPHAAQAAGLPLRTAEDLAAGRALSVDLTNAAWRNDMGYGEMPVWTAAEAGAVFARLASDHDLTFFDNWAPDAAGHAGDFAASVRLLEEIDAFLGGLLATIDHADTLIMITSDHGNVEDIRARGHTENPVPTILIGAGHRRIADSIRSLTDLTPALLQVLNGP